MLLHLLPVKYPVLPIFLYNIFLLLFRAGTHIAALFSPKAKKWVEGRKGLMKKIQTAIPSGEKTIWVHCASLGEFEQGRPVMESLKKEYPSYKLLLTFFSPSGFEVQKNYKGADWIFYLPMDSPGNAREFLETVRPVLVIFVKYEFWYYYLKKIKYRNIPLLLISALFRKDMSFFKWYGGLQRKILSRFDRLFVQNESSAALLHEIGLGDITSVSGDTRFDRVTDIAARFEPIPVIEQFAGNCKLIIAGSTWREDEELLASSMDFCRNNRIKIVIAPHEVSPGSIDFIKEKFPGALLYSEAGIAEKDPAVYDCLIVDNIGMLSRLYNYGYCCFIGGGMKESGIHNVLEAAVYSKPVFFGPFYKKYHEAIDLAETGGAFPVKDAGEFTGRLENFLNDTPLYEAAAANAGEYVRSNTGAVKKIMYYIEEKRLLTS